MNRNVESRFSLAPSVNIPRSVNSDRPTHTTSFNVGQLIPIFWDEILPGQSMRMALHSVLRTQPMVTCPLDDLFCDVYAWFIPNRLIWSHWKEFMGENTTSPWVSSVQYTVPQLFIDRSAGQTNQFGTVPGTIADYMGVPIFKFPSTADTFNRKVSVSALPFRAYALTVREWFQDQNLETPINVPLDDSDRYIASNGMSASVINDPMNIHQGTFPYIVNRYHDYFSSATPGPTKSLSDVLAFPDMPVIVDPDNTLVSDNFDKFYPDGASTDPGKYYDVATQTQKDGYPIYIKTTDTDFSVGYPLNMFAISGVTINDLRNAFAVQRLLERDLYGTRYRTMLKAHFGVNLPDSTAQVPQYLGGYRHSLNISQILQTSETDNTPQGNVAGFSLSSESDYLFDHSFSEHGILLITACVRYQNRFQNGINKKFSRKTRFDYYFPEMAALGNMPIFKKELFVDGSPTDDDVFGYNEAWSEYRYHPSYISGQMRSGVTGSLDSWHFGDYYTTHPSLSRSWMMMDKGNVDRVLAVNSSVSNQLLGDFMFDIKNTLPMPLYNIPGLNGTF